MTFFHGFVFFIQKVSLQEQRSFLAFVSAGKGVGNTYTTKQTNKNVKKLMPSFRQSSYIRHRNLWGLQNSP